MIVVLTTRDIPEKFGEAFTKLAKISPDYRGFFR